MPRCTCAGNSCSCLIQAGSNVTVEGKGTASDPYIVSAEGGSGADDADVAALIATPGTVTGAVLNATIAGQVSPLVADAIADDDTVALAAAAAVGDAIDDADIPGIVDDALAGWDREGNGPPTGVVTAPVGTRYRDLDATRGAVLWVKASGSGSSGWRVVSGDTGWRNVTADAINGWTASDVRMRRVGQQIELRVSGLSGAAASSGIVMNIAAGFRSWNGAQPGVGLLLTAAGVVRRATFADTFTVVGFSSADSFTTSAASWLSDATAWPSSLPGSPV